MQTQEIAYDKVPISLLLEADPSLEAIERYLSRSRCFVTLSDNQIVGVCVVLAQSSDRYEIMNIAVRSDRQRQGIGRMLLSSVLKHLKKINASAVRVSTGTFGYQLAFYQRAGFRVKSVETDYFLKNYDEPIIENGIQHKDQLVMEINFPS